MGAETNDASVTPLDVEDLRGKVRFMYQAVARQPHDGHFHFEMGRALMERLGYSATDLDRVPAAALESFAGVGYFHDLAALTAGQTVVDLGSGSGSDAFIAALHVGHSGRVIGIDMTDAQLEKATGLARANGFAEVEFREGLIEKLPIGDEEADCVISNGVINLAPDKIQVLAEAARVLRPGGRFAFADIVTDLPLPANVTCNTTLWAACIGGAAQRDEYLAYMEAAGLHVVSARTNAEYAFLSRSAQNASREYGVKSVSFLAVKENRMSAPVKVADTLDAYGVTCGMLEPMIARRLRTLLPGEVLEVRSDMPEAKDGIAAWLWLTGHTLLAVEEDLLRRARYYVRKNSEKGA